MKTFYITVRVLVLLQSSINMLCSQIDIKVYCKKTNEPIPYASISWNQGKYGSICDEKGKISLSILPSEMLVTALGYNDSIYIIDELNDFNDTLFLIPAKYSLPEVTIRSNHGKKRTIEISSKQKSSITCDNTSYKFCIGNSVELKQMSQIMGVTFHVLKLGEYHPHKIRLRIIKLDESMYPSKDVLNEFVELKPKKKGKITLDLADLNLVVDSGQYLFALEWLVLDQEILDEIHSKPYNQYKTLSIRVYVINSSYSENIWHKRGDFPWRMMEFEGDHKVFGPWMRIELNEF